VTARWRSYGLAAFAAVLAIAFSSSTASATFPGANGRIAFLSTFIHTTRSNGSDDQRLVRGTYPAWSPNGSHIAFTGFVTPQQTAVFTMRANGGGVRRLAHSRSSEGAAGYSPNGRRILFVRVIPNRVLIATIRVDGSDERVVARGNFGPVEYSPNGRRILYIKDCRVWTMRPDGSHKHQLTHSASELPCDNSPDYSPDGRHIVFERRSRLHVMRSDGSHAHALNCGRPASQPQYSPNGRKLVWTGRIGQGQSASSDIFTSTLRCTDPFRVTRYAGVGGASEPSWQPLPGG
jgi:Tol biopolymer transport system component